MEVPILILEDALRDQKEQLSKSEKFIPKNDKQDKLKSTGIANLNGFIAEIEEAINILKSNERETVRKHEHEKKDLQLKCRLNACAFPQRDECDGCRWYK